MVKNLPAVWGTWVQSLGWEDPLEKGMATHSSILTQKIPWTEETGRLQSMESQELDILGELFSQLYRSLATNGDGGGLVDKSCPTLATPWIVTCQSPLSMEFSG